MIAAQKHLTGLLWRLGSVLRYVAVTSWQYVLYAKTQVHVLSELVLVGFVPSDGFEGLFKSKMFGGSSSSRSPPVPKAKSGAADSSGLFLPRPPKSGKSVAT